MMAVRIAIQYQRVLTLRHSQLSGSISPQGKKAKSVIARQFEQWQLYATTNSSATS
jgi:hypothetical protein